MEPTPTPDATDQRPDCDCPELLVLGGLTSVNTGEEIEFYADLTDDRFTILVYNWTVENGKIISGQGTDQITVLTDANTKAHAVTATLQIPAYDTYCDCPTTASASIPFSEYSYIADANQFANVDELILDENSLVKPCEPGTTPLEGTKESPDMIIDVTTKATDPENDPLTYNYKISAGTIIGKGAKVLWDLSGAEPGTYSITAGVDDGCGLCGRTITKVVEVLNCSPTCGTCRLPYCFDQRPEFRQ